MAEEMQALGPDLLEAVAHAKTMTPEEIEETIDYILDEVFLPPVVIAWYFLMLRTKRSTGKILLVVTSHPTGLRDKTSLSSFPELPPSRHRSSQALPL